MTDAELNDSPMNSEDRHCVILSVRSLEHVVKGVLIAPTASMLFTPAALYTGFDTLRTNSVFYQEYLDGLSQDPPFQSGEVKLIIRAQVRNRFMALHSDGRNIFLTKRGRIEYPQELTRIYGPGYPALFCQLGATIWDHIANYQPPKREQGAPKPVAEPDIFDLIAAQKKE